MLRRFDMKNTTSKSGARVGGIFKAKLWTPWGPARWLFMLGISTTFLFKHLKMFHRVKWADVAGNRVVNVGLQHILDILFVSATTQIDPWYIGLTAATPVPAAADTMSTHAGWTEFINYTEGVRQTYIDVRSAQQVTNNANKASYAINTDSSSIGGAFLTSDSAKSGTAGTLCCCAAFSGGNKAADDGDTLEVEYQFSAADDGV